jgi:putative SOS response-associated peptidase YedK
MCGRYSLFTPPGDLTERFGADFGGVEPTYNAAPGQQLPVIRDETPDAVDRLSWGLVPAWADDPDESPAPINARSETVTEKPTFREAYRRRRCLVPADGFYEWSETAPDGRQSGPGKTPYRVAFEDDRPFALAGIWETWEGEPVQTGLGDFADDGGRTRRVDSFTVLTTAPNDLVADLHDRMAVVLPPEEESRWLTAEDPTDLLEPFPADEMRAYPVSPRVNDPTNDDPSLVDPAEA